MGRIIVVEDNIIYSDFVCRLLESKGYPSVSTSTCNPTAVRSMKQGAEDYIPKKLIETNLFPLLKTLQKRLERHDTPIHERQSTAFREIYRKIKLVAPTNMSILILGESGTGKEHIAEKIHTMSKRAGKPFVAVDCGLLSKELAASSLFGHEKGAFTGAESKKQGSRKQETGVLGRSRRRHIVPRRDRQPSAGSAADAAPRIGSQTVQTHGRQQGQAG